jgi:hypothetical protein
MQFMVFKPISIQFKQIAYLIPEIIVSLQLRLVLGLKLRIE